MAIGPRTLWTGLRARMGAETDDEVTTPHRAFTTAVAATALNPLTIALWTISFPAAAPSSTATSVEHAALLLSGVTLGTLSWYCGFSAAVALARHRLRPRVLAAVDIATGSGLIAFGALLGYRTLQER